MVFFLLIVMIVFASFTIILNQNTGLEQTTIQAKQLDLDRYTELQTVSIANPETAVLNKMVYLLCDVTNNGTLPTELTRLWIRDITNNTIGNVLLSPSLVVQPGSSIEYFKAVPVLNASNYDQFSFWFVTTRGNLISCTPNINQFNGISTIGASSGQNSGFANNTTPIQLYVNPTKPNDLIYMAVAYDDGNTLNPPASTPILTWATRITSASTDRYSYGDAFLRTYYAISPGGPINITLSVSGTENNDYYWAAVAFAISNVNVASPFDSSGPQSSIGSSSPVKDTINTGSSNELVIGAVEIDTLTPQITPGAGFTQVLPPQFTVGATGDSDAYPRSVWVETSVIPTPTNNLSVNCTYNSNRPWAIVVDAVNLVVTPPVVPVSLSPGSGPIGQPITVSGGGFAANSRLIATFGGAQVPFVFTTDGSGNIPPNAIFNVPQGTTAGNKTVTIVDSKFNYASANFTVTTPNVTLNPQTGPDGTTVTLTGSNFIANSTIALTFDGNPMVSSPSAVSANATGSFSVTFTPSTTVGIKQVLASDGVNSVNSSFTVIPSIVTTPKNGLTGTPVTISGQGFAPNSIVTVKFDGTLTSTSPPIIVTDVNGSFSGVTFSAVSPNIGSKIINATDASGNSVTDTFNIVTLSRFTITGCPSSILAETNFNSITVTAYDSNNNVINGYLRQVYFTSTDNNAILPYTSSSMYTFTLDDSGSHIFSGFTLETTGSKVITVTNGTISQSSSVIVVNPGALDHFAISGTPISVTAGQSFGNVVVAVYDVYGNLKTDFTGQVYFTSTDAAAVLPYTSGSKYTFVSGDQGDHIFSGFALKTTGSKTITVTDNTRFAASNGITVNPGVLNHFTMTGVQGSVTAGQVFGSVVVTAYDANNNVKTDYTGQVYFTSTDGAAVLPYTSGSKYTFTSGVGLDNGVHSFGGFALKTVGSRTITVTDGATSLASGTITVGFAPIDHFAVTGFTNPVVAGTAGSVTVTAQDPYGNTVTSYVGTVHIASSDGAAVRPADHVLASGVYTFTNGVTLKTTGVQSITATDVATGLITGSQTGITVNPAAIASFTIAGYPSSVAAGTSFGGVVVAAYDTYGNVKTDFTSTVYFTSTDGAAVLPYTSGAKYTFVSGDLGVHTFAGFTLKTVGSKTITVTDGTRSAVSSGITVVPGAIDHFTFGGLPASVTAGSSFAGSVTVTAYDSSNNVKTDYVGSVYFTSSDAQAVLPFTVGAQYTFLSSENGVHAFAGSGFTLKTAPSQTITVRDDVASKSSASGAITVNFAALDHFTFNNVNSPQVAGTGFSITITAQDVYGNTVTSYTTAGTLSDLSGAISPTASGAFVSGVRTVTVTITKAYSGDTISISASSKSGTSNAFTVNPGTGNFGYTTIGSSTYSIEDTIYGSQFATPTYGVTAQSITAYITVSSAHNVKAAIYTSSGALVASSSDVPITAATDGWVTFTLTNPTALTASTNYVLVVWANNPTGSDTATVSRDSLSGGSRVVTLTYGTWPNSVTFTTGNYEASLYCNYSIP